MSHIDINLPTMNADDGFDVAWNAAWSGGAMFTRKSYKLFKSSLRERGFANENETIDEDGKFVTSQWVHENGQVLDVAYRAFKYTNDQDYDVTGTLVRGAVAPESA